jgi:glycosyltransferase involved in cell wall biosynthesis
MKGLVIAPQPFFTHRGTPFSVYYRARAMAELGEQLDLVTYGQGLDVSLPGVRIIRGPRFKLFGDVKIGPSALKLLLDTFVFFQVIYLLIRNKYDYVHAHEEAIFIAVMLRPFFRYKIIYDMHSSLPEQLANFSFTRIKWVTNLVTRMEHRALRASDVVIVICPSLYEYAETILQSAKRIILIENSLFDPVELRPIREITDPTIATELAEMSQQGKIRLIVYAGTLERYQGIDLLLESFSLLYDRYDDVNLLILGGTKAQVAYYSTLARSLGITERCYFTGRVRQGLAVHCNDCATIVVSPRTVGTNTPLKIYGQMAGGVPIVATRVETHTQVLTDDIAILVDASASSFAEGIQRVLDSPEQAEQIAESAYRHYLEHYSRPVFMKKVQQFLDDVART